MTIISYGKERAVPNEQKPLVSPINIQVLSSLTCIRKFSRAHAMMAATSTFKTMGLIRPLVNGCQLRPALTSSHPLILPWICLCTNPISRSGMVAAHLSENSLSSQCRKSIGIQMPHIGGILIKIHLYCDNNVSMHYSYLFFKYLF